MPQTKLCQEPGCDRPVRCKGRCTKHYQQWLKAQGRIGKLQTCEHCRGEFRAPSDRPFCNFDCYLASDRRKRHDRERAKRLTKAELVGCLHCGTEMPVPPCQKRRGKRFCSQACWRAYLAGRFDRWVANPRTVETLQGYDEFLAQEHLPCLVEGCGWTGKNLGRHVNLAHGLTADAFKELAGFNTGTGLVAAETQRKMTRQALKNRKQGRLKNGPTGKSRGRAGQRLRREHLEHLAKARAVRAEEVQ